MILASVIHTDNGDTPNAGSNLHLSNQVGQDDFKLGGNITLRNTGPADFVTTLTIVQCLLNDADVVASIITKDVPVTVPAGKSVSLTPLATGSIPMKGVDTKGTRFRYRLEVKNGTEVVSDTVTGVAFDQTNTVFTSLTVPFAAAGPGNANAAIVAEITKNEVEMSTLPVEISTKQARLAKLTARNTALKSAVPV